MRVAVVGGGLAGLAAAEALVSRGATVTVLEATSRFGGQVSTERSDGFLIEHGAEGFPARRPVVPGLCARLSLTDGLVPQRTNRALVLRDGRLVELPNGEAVRILGMRVDPADLGAGLVTLMAGMEELVAALEERLDAAATLRPDWPIHEIQREEGGWTLRGEAAAEFRADAVVLALPAPRTASLLTHGVGLVSALEALPCTSSVTVSLGFRRSDVGHPLDASGFVVANADQDGLRACVFSSSKFPGRAPPGAELVRAFFRPETAELGEADDYWIGKATEALAEPLLLVESPLHGWVSRWPEALPQYRPDHPAVIAELREALRSFGGLELAGSAVDQGGVDGAVRSGQMAADRVLASHS